MQVWSVLYAARWKDRRQKIAKNSPSAHHRTTLTGYNFATKALIDNRKNSLNSNISSTCPHSMVNFGLLAAEIGWRVWGTPTKFNVFRVLPSLLYRRPTSLSGGQPNFALRLAVSWAGTLSGALPAFSRGRHLYLSGRPSRWALAHILVRFYRATLC